MKRFFSVAIFSVLSLFCQLAAAYNGNLNYVICDIKRPLASVGQKNLNIDNYQRIISSLRDKLQCNALRVYIDVTGLDPENYPAIYQAVFHYARKIGMKIYANPLGTGRQGLSNRELIDIVVRYADFYQPEFLGPFNETGISVSDMKYIAGMIKDQLHYGSAMVGPDTQQVNITIDKISGASNLEDYFDIIGSHNAEHDDNAVLSAWRLLAGEARRPVWASENPKPWSVQNAQGEEMGVAALVDANSPVSGLVIYLAFPRAIDQNGNLTPFGQALASGIGLRE